MRPPLALIAVASVLVPGLPARADSAHAFCRLSPHDHTATVTSGPCVFSQRQGNANVSFNGVQYDFPAKDDGKSYRRSNEETGIRFHREGDYTLTVLWRQPGAQRGSTNCVMNPQMYGYNWKPCTIAPLAGVKDGFTVRFAGSYDAPWFTFRPAPGSQPTTNGRLMVDGQGKPWRLHGHHSFVITEVGGEHNRLEVSAD